MIRIVGIGRKHETWVEEGIARYEKRLKKPFDIEWRLLPHSSYETTRARSEETTRLLARTTSDDFVILLDERGVALDSPGLSRLLDTSFSTGKKVVLILGGAYGVDPSLHTRADMVWSLSPLVFPHQLVRLILVEQLYRAQEIVNGRAYHHG